MNYTRLTEIDNELSSLSCLENYITKGTKYNPNTFVGIPTGQDVSISIDGQVYVSSLRVPFSYTEKVLVVALLNNIKQARFLLNKERLQLLNRPKWLDDFYNSYLYRHPFTVILATGLIFFFVWFFHLLLSSPS
jgi:hypothetical protein